MEEIINVYIAGMRTESDREIATECVKGPFENVNISEAANITPLSDRIFFGDISLEINKTKQPYVPGPDSVMKHTPTTLRYLRQLAKAVRMEEKPLLVGPTGAAKTSLIRYLAYLTQNSFVRVSLDAQADVSELIGHNVPKEGSVDGFQWIDGKLIDAMAKGYWILLDEFNLAEPEILERINPLLDDDGSIIITELNNQTWVPAFIFRKKLNKK